MKSLMQQAYVKVDSALHNERGAQAIEWIALAGVVIAIFAAVQAAFKGNTEVGSAVSTTLSKLIKSLSGSE